MVASPACLGIYGCATWADPEAVEELVADCFVFVFAERFRSLKAHLRDKPNVEGLILRNEEAARAEELRPHVLAWNDDLLPDLITARGWDVRQVTARLERHLHRLAPDGIRAFRFHDLVNVLRQDARARWRAVWVHSPEGIPPLLEEGGFAAVAAWSSFPERTSARACASSSPAWSGRSNGSRSRRPVRATISGGCWCS